MQIEAVCHMLISGQKQQPAKDELILLMWRRACKCQWQQQRHRPCRASCDVEATWKSPMLRSPPFAHPSTYRWHTCSISICFHPRRNSRGRNG